MPGKRRIVETLKRQDLLALADHFGLEVADRRVHDQLVDALASSTRARLPEILGRLKRATLKETCRQLELDDSGREKSLLVDRLLGNKAPEPPTGRQDAPEPASPSPYEPPSLPSVATRKPTSPAAPASGRFKETSVQTAMETTTSFPVMTPSLAPPVQGQLVQVRQRRYVVNEVLESDLASDPLTASAGPARQHLVSLSSVEDDGLGEELQVVWEIEPGARIYERASLPEFSGFDDPARLDALLDAVRWGAVASADHKALHGPFRSGIATVDYQLDPVVRALQMPRANLLLADDVGLGKTIEAGLVIQELLVRHRARSVLVVCPAGLQVQWREQMRDKFGLEFRIVDSDMMRELRRRRGLFVNPWTHFPRLITSIDFLKRDRPLRLFREVLPADGESAFPRRLDIMVLDEAHNAAPQGKTHYAIDSERTKAIRALVPHFEHKLFLTATPHNGFTDSFAALLEMLDDQRFHRRSKPDQQQLGTIMVRRLKTELVDWDGKPRFRGRNLNALEVAYTDEEREIHRALTRYAELRRQNPTDDTEYLATEFVLKLLKKRLFSSPAAFLSTLEKHRTSITTARKKTQKKGAIVKPSLNVLRRHIDQAEEESASDDAYEETTEEALDSASRLFRPLSPEEEKLLGHMHAWAEKAASSEDVKAQCLLDWLGKTLKPNNKWNDERMIIFTEYRATQKWLHQILSAAGFAENGRLLTIYGGMKSEDRESIKAAFQAGPRSAAVRILLATDAASEGIDLQNHCHRLFHYEIPWNPNRMEQRNGRVDRYGQRFQVEIFHFVGKGYQRVKPTQDTKPGDLEGDLEFLMRAAQKVESIREDLGKVGPVIASQVAAAMLGKRTTLDTSSAEKEATPAAKLLRIERKLGEEVERLRKQLNESRHELRLSPENIEKVVRIGLELAGQPPLRETEVEGIWPDPSGARTRCPVFHVPVLQGSWARCTEGLADPYSKQIRPIVFDPHLIENRDEVVLAHLNHRLVQTCLRLLRAEVWSPEEQKRLNRATARIVPSSVTKEPVVVAHARVVVLGGDNTRLHEELIAAAGSIEKGKFSQLNVGRTEQVMSTVTDASPSGQVKERLVALWPELRDPLFAALKERMEAHGKSRQKMLAGRAKKEAEDIRTILTELKASLEKDIAAGPPDQLSLFDRDELSQYERTKASLVKRLERIPGEIERETAAIEARYASPTAHLFPVAVSFLVPQHLAGEGGH